MAEQLSDGRFGLRAALDSDTAKEITVLLAPAWKFAPWDPL